MKILYVREKEIDIEFADFQQRLAMALCGDHPQSNLLLAALAADLPKELEAAVLAGKLPVKNPLTLGPESFPVGNALLTSRVMVSDIGIYVKARGVSVASMPEVVKQARIEAVDPLLLTFPLHAPVYYTDNLGAGSGAGICKVGDFIECENDRIKRQAKGYFTVDEAAQVLADAHPGIDVRKMIERMKMAEVNGLRLVRDHGDRFPIAGKDNFYEYLSLVRVADVDAWLKFQEVGYQFPAAEAVPTSNDLQEAKPKQRSKAQEEAILSMLQRNGHDPVQLVKNESGKPGVKSQIRRALGSGGMWTGRTVFNKAWERLRSNGQLVDK
jgi:hypothetical protein